MNASAVAKFVWHHNGLVSGPDGFFSLPGSCKTLETLHAAAAKHCQRVLQKLTLEQLQL